MKKLFFAAIDTAMMMFSDSTEVDTTKAEVAPDVA